MNRITFLIVFLLTSLVSNGQQISKEDIKNAESRFEDGFDFNYRNKWKYFTLDNTITVKIVKHWPAWTGCGVVCTSSLTIAKTSSGELIRILDMCNNSGDFHDGQTVKVEPGVESDDGSCLPDYGNRIDAKTGKIILADIKTVLKTTWGHLLLIK